MLEFDIKERINFKGLLYLISINFENNYISKYFINL